MFSQICSRGYHILRSRTQRDKAYSAYLAALMTIFGSSGLTLIIGSGLLLILQVIGWSALYAYVFATRIEKVYFVQSVLLMIFLSTVIALSQGGLSAHHLLLCVFPFLYLSASKAFFERENGQWLRWFAIYTVLSAIFVSAHNTAVPMIAALSVRILIS